MSYGDTRYQIYHIMENVAFKVVFHSIAVAAQLNQRMDQTITQSLTSRQPSAATGCVVPFFTQMKRGKGVISPTITYRVIFNI